MFHVTQKKRIIYKLKYDERTKTTKICNKEKKRGEPSDPIKTVNYIKNIRTSL